MRSISDELKDNEMLKTDFSTFSEHEKIADFSSFSDEVLRYFGDNLNLNLTIAELNCIKDFYKNLKGPTIFELRVFESYLQTEESLLLKKIYRIETASNNPHIRKAVELFNSINLQYKNDKLFRTLKGINYFAFLQLQEQNHGSIAHDNFSMFLKCKCTKGDEKTNLFIGCSKSIRDDLNYAVSAAISKNHSNGLVPEVIAIREVLVGDKTFAEQINKDFFPTVLVWQTTDTEVYSDNLSLFEVMSIGQSLEIKKDLERDYSKDVLVLIEGSKSNLINSQNFESLLTDGLFRHFSFYSVCTDNGIINGLIKLNIGFDIYLNFFPQTNLSTEDLLTARQRNTYIVSLSKKHLHQFSHFCNLRNFNTFEIGRANNRKYIRIFKNSFLLSTLNFNFFDKNLNKGSFFRIEDFNSEEDSGDAPFNSSYELAIDQKVFEYSQILSNRNYDAFRTGKTLFSPLKGIRQAAKSSVISFNPQSEIVGLKIGLAVGLNFSYLNLFLTTVNSIFSAVLKLVILGYPIHQIVTSLTFVCRVDNKEIVQTGLFSVLMGILHTQLVPSIPNINFNISKTSGLFSEPLILASAIGYTNNKIISEDFSPGQKLFLISIKYDEYKVPDVKYLLKLSSLFNMQILSENIKSAIIVQKNIFSSIIDLTVGDNYGFSFAQTDVKALFSHKGDIIVAISDIREFDNIESIYLGVMDDSGIVRVGNEKFISNQIFERALIKNKSTLSPTISAVPRKLSSMNNFSRHIETPEILIITYDKNSAEIFRSVAHKAGFRINIRLLSILIPFSDDYLKGLRSDISNANILVFSGQDLFEEIKAGDLLYAFLRRSEIIDAVNELIFRNEGLILSTAEGTRALFKIGLLPNGTAEKTPYELESNTQSPERSVLNRVRIMNVTSPWLHHISPGDIFKFPFPEEAMQFSLNKFNEKSILANGQIIAQYIDFKGDITIDSVCNPTGSNQAVATIASPKGNVLGFFSPIEKIYNLQEETESLLDLLFKSAKEYFNGKF